MKSYLTPLLFTAASLIAINANAGIIAPSFIPTEPTVTAPADQASDVDTTAEFTSSEYQSDEDSLPEPSTLKSSNWIISKESAGITVLGGQQIGIAPLNFGLTFAIAPPPPEAPVLDNIIQYDIPFPIVISGQAANKVQMDFDPSARKFNLTVNILSEAGNVIASANMALADFTLQSDKEFVLTKTATNALLFQWYVNSPTAGDAIVEFILIDGGLNTDKSAKDDVIGWRTSPNELALTVFDSNQSGASCGISADGISAPTEATRFDNSLPGWKETLGRLNFTKFFIACTSKTSEVETPEPTFDKQFKSLTILNVDNFSTEIKTYSSDTDSYELNDAESLALDTAYTAQVQHIGTYEQSTAASSWSDPVSFTTRTADTNYQVTAPTDLAFTAGEAKDLAFKISNAGTEAGAPQVTIRLPFKVLSVLNGTLSDFFEVSIGEQNCSMNQSGEKTDFVCQLDSLAANAEVQLAAKITAKDATVKSVQYQVCESAKCAATEFTTVNITVTSAPTNPAPTDPAPTDPAPTDPKDETTSSSSSSGGSMFWLFLMAPLLLVRRK